MYIFIHPSMVDLLGVGVSKKPATAAQKRYLDKVKALPCSACDKSGPSAAHHPRFSQGTSQRASHWLATALCYECHQGSFSIHNSPIEFTAVYGEELKLLATTIERMNQ